MNNFIKLNPIRKINGTIILPGSKSISNRALLLAAQAEGVTKLTNLLDSDDVRCMLVALRSLGVTYRLSDDRKTCEVDGICGALQLKNNNQLILSVGNAGTVMRPLIAALSIKSQNIIITGSTRMKDRPVRHLVDALKQGGSRINYIENNGYPPVQLYGGYFGGSISIQGNISSQFLSSILMMAPLARRDTYITVHGTLVSKPYVDMTVSLMRHFGVDVINKNYRVFCCKGNQVYRSPGNYLIEGDASSASYFLAASAIRGGTVRVLGVGKHSKQGDVYFAKILEDMGAIVYWGDHYIECTRGIELNSVDMDVNNIPDAAMTLAVVGLFTNNGPTILRNIYNWRVKESDRLTAMASELRKVGAQVIEGYDYLRIFPPVRMRSACINTYNDHRIAMCFSLVALSDVSVIIHDPKCTDKTFPDFFEQLSKISIL